MEDISMEQIYRSKSKRLKDIEAKAMKMLSTAKSEKTKQIIREQLYYATLRAKYGI